MKKCTQCGQTLSDDSKFCYNCGGSDFEQTAESTGAYQQPSYQQPPSPPPQQPYYSQPSYQVPPSYQRGAGEEPVSIGMYILFLIVSSIPLVGLIFAIVVAASSSFKRSYINLARAWLIVAAIGLVIGLIAVLTMGAFFSEFYNSFNGGYYYNY